MFGKLLKYDFRSMLKQFAFIWPAALLLALVNRFTVSGVESTSVVGNTTAGIALFIYVAILIAMFVIALIFIIQRFYKGLLGDEGYLMHTLPVKPWHLIGSKLLAAVVTTVLSVLTALLSIFLIASQKPLSDLADFFRFFGYYFRAWGVNAGIARDATHAIIMMAEFLLFFLVGLAATYLRLYLSMSIGHLFNRHRVAWSVAAYTGIDIVMSILLTVLGNMGAIDSFFDMMKAALDSTTGTLFGRVHMCLWIMIGSQVVIGAIYFLGTEYILRKRLNLE